MCFSVCNCWRRQQTDSHTKVGWQTKHNNKICRRTRSIDHGENFNHWSKLTCFTALKKTVRLLSYVTYHSIRVGTSFLARLFLEGRGVRQRNEKWMEERTEKNQGTTNNLTILFAQKIKTTKKTDNSQDLPPWAWQDVSCPQQWNPSEAQTALSTSLNEVMKKRNTTWCFPLFCGCCFGVKTPGWLK